MAIADIRQWTPFIFILALAALQSLPKSVIDGLAHRRATRYLHRFFTGKGATLPDASGGLHDFDIVHDRRLQSLHVMADNP